MEIEDYEGMDVNEYPERLREVIDLMIEWNQPVPVYEISTPS